MNIFGLHITTAKAHKKERKSWSELVKQGTTSLLEAASIMKAVKAEYAKENKLWNRVISKLLWENHNLRLAE